MRWLANYRSGLGIGNTGRRFTGARLRLWAPVVLALSLFAVSCGDDAAVSSENAVSDTATTTTEPDDHEVGPPGCDDVESFAALNRFRGFNPDDVDRDYTPSVSPWDLSDTADAVVRGELVAMDRTGWLIYTLRVTEVIVANSTQPIGAEIEIAQRYNAQNVAAISSLEDAFVPGIPALVAIDFSPDDAGLPSGAWVPHLGEGFWVGCDGSAFVASWDVPVWAPAIGTLDDLAAAVTDSCSRIESFAARNGRFRGISLQPPAPSDTPADLADTADAVVRGELVSVDSRSAGWSVLTLRVAEVLVATSMQPRTTEVEIWQRFDAETEDAFVPGMSALVFLALAESSPAGWRPLLEGFWVGCDDGRAFMASSFQLEPIWAPAIGSLDDLAAAVTDSTAMKCSDLGGSMVVDETCIPESWPLTITQGVLSCENVNEVLFAVGGFVYGLNPNATSRGFAGVDPIRADAGDGRKVDIRPLVVLGLGLCETDS